MLRKIAHLFTKRCTRRGLLGSYLGGLIVNRRQSFTLMLSVLCCALASEIGRCDPQDEPKQPTKLPGEEGPLRGVVWRGNAAWLGDFDKDGNFLRDPRFSPDSTGIGTGFRFQRAFMCFDVDWLVYEHRSGRAIKGTMVRKPFGVVIPEIGSTVLDIKDVDLKDPDRAVWNMPEVGPAQVAARIKKHGNKPAPKAPEPPQAGVPESYEFTPFSKMETNLLGQTIPPERRKPIKHARAIGDIVEFGHLSDEGEFIPDPDLPPVSRAGILGPIKFDPFGTPRYYTVPQQTGPKREGQKETTEAVYEYRSGRLIKGTLQANGNFVPELGSKVIDFKDYGPNFPRRIYNLPGVLKKKAE